MVTADSAGGWQDKTTNRHVLQYDVLRIVANKKGDRAFDEGDVEPSSLVAKNEFVVVEHSATNPTYLRTRTSTALELERPSAIDAQGEIMLAHSAVRAEESRADLADGEVLPAKPNAWTSSTPRRVAWKRHYEDYLWSIQLTMSQRGVLLTLSRLSDPMGRVWWGQTAIAELAGCSDRNLRRLLVLLEQGGYLRSETHSFKSLTAAQQALGLPLPDRDDEGRSPDVLTLLVDGVAAWSFDYEAPRLLRVRVDRQDKPIRDKHRRGSARAAPGGQLVQGEPRTKTPRRPPDKLADDLLGSAFLTRKEEGDLGGPPRSILVVETSERENVAAQNDSPPPTETPSHIDAWRALNAAYDAHYRRVYHATPTEKRVSSEEVQAMTTHLVEVAEHFEKRLSEHGVGLEHLEKRPLHMLADEALRSWFASPGTNDYLRRVSHSMRSLVADLPYRLRKARDALLQQLVPKPEPRRASESPEIGRRVVYDKPPPVTLEMPTFGPTMERPSMRATHATNLGREARRLLESLAVRSAPLGFGVTVHRADMSAAGGTT